jgi:tetratricopeptide (TPR) repeat protein
VLLLSLTAAAFFASTRRSGYPITFGILWYFLALAPTSSIIIIDQLANDHRTFLPNIGLVLAFGWSLELLRRRWQERIRGSAVLRWGLVAMGVAVYLLYAYGTYRRNEVWSSADRLWADGAQKSPNNGRALMNYGLTLMARGDYDGAERQFRRTLQLMPTWAYIHINMGILRNARGFPAEAEEYFKNAIRYQPTVPEGYYYYGRWLLNQGRRAEAQRLVEEGLRLSPSHIRLQGLRADIAAGNEPDRRINDLQKALGKSPSAEGYLELSLALYRAGRFEECIQACEQAIVLKPDFALAYNNLCSAYNSLGEWDRAIAACNRALEIAPQFDLARNNLKWAMDKRSKTLGARRP